MTRFPGIWAGVSVAVIATVVGCGSSQPTPTQGLAVQTEPTATPYPLDEALLVPTPIAPGADSSVSSSSSQAGSGSSETEAFYGEVDRVCEVPRFSVPGVMRVRFE